VYGRFVNKVGSSPVKESIELSVIRKLQSTRGKANQLNILAVALTRKVRDHGCGQWYRLDHHLCHRFPPSTSDESGYHLENEMPLFNLAIGTRTSSRG
jgi:hypothetical protein